MWSLPGGRGGWPEDDFYCPPEVTRLFLTLRESEPWYSVWRSARG